MGGFKDEDAFDDDDRSEYDDEEGGEGDEDAGDDDSSERRRSRHRGGKGFTQQWTKEEDDELVALIEKYGAKRWSYIASHMRRRRGKQCRDRYLNHLRPGIKTGEWSAEEEQILIEGHKALGTKWAALAKLLVGRPENAIKNHWHATLRCKTHKTRGEAPKISALKRYQMSLAQSAENGRAEDGRGGADEKSRDGDDDGDERDDGDDRRWCGESRRHESIGEKLAVLESAARRNRTRV